MNIIQLCELPDEVRDAIGAGDAVGALALPVDQTPNGLANEIRAAGMVICGRLAVIDGVAYWGVDLQDAAKILLSDGLGEGPPTGWA